jgi:hypothetical protein
VGSRCATGVVSGDVVPIFFLVEAHPVLLMDLVYLIRYLGSLALPLLFFLRGRSPPHDLQCIMRRYHLHKGSGMGQGNIPQAIQVSLPGRSTPVPLGDD